ncbi:MAG TPA: SDR family NAD(P)-dependent oxidoreductase, partial [Vicinamibacterales bacterium]|nr:SDR family NAD(P)-dependent oxidoreductase [Vicinamibacterales bacterium]
MGRLDGRVVAITGASAGIGRATAERVAAEGGAVVVSARREALLAELVAAIRGRGGRAIAVAADVTIEADADRLVTATIEAFGRLDVMICNAGIGYHGTLEEATTAAMRRVVDVNV